LQDIDHFQYALTEESRGYLTAGSPEAQVFQAIGTEGLPLAALKVATSMLRPAAAGQLEHHVD
jgi:hypothetical protein